MSDTLEEIAYTLGRVQAELEDLAVGGLRVAGPSRLAALEAMRADLEAMGALHLATRLARLAEAIGGQEREAAVALMQMQASLRVFERVFSLEVVAARLGALAADARGADA